MLPLWTSQWAPSHQVFEQEEIRIALNFLSALFSVLGPFLTEDHGPITSDTKHDFSNPSRRPILLTIYCEELYEAIRGVFIYSLSFLTVTRE